MTVFAKSFVSVLFVALGLVLLLVGIFFRDVDKEEKKKQILTALGLIALLVMGVILQIFTNEANKEPDYLQKNQPYLSSLLIFDKNETNKHYKYKITNIGNYPAIDLTISSRMQDISYMENVSEGRSLAPGESIVVPIEWDATKCPSKASLLTNVLTVVYLAKIQNSKRRYSAIYTFRILGEIEYNQEYSPTGIKRDDSESALDSTINYLEVAKSLDKETGQIELELNKLELDSKGPPIVIGAPRRTIAIVQKDRKVIFQSIDNNIITEKVIDIDAVGKNVFTVEASWIRNNIELTAKAQ